MQQVNLGNAIKNDMWITDPIEQPDPDVLPALPGFHVLIRPVSVKSLTKGGIIIPDSTKDDMSYLTTIGKVLSLGDIAYADKEKFPSHDRVGSSTRSIIWSSNKRISLTPL